MASAKSECVNWLAGWVRPLFITHSDAHSGQFRMAIVTGAALAPAIALEDRNRMKCMVCATCTKARACAAKYFLRFYAMNFEPAPTQLKENAINWTVNWRWPSSQHPENETIILFPYYEQTHTMWPLDYPQTCLYCGLSGHNHAHTPEHMHVNPVQRHILHRPRANGQTGMCVWLRGGARQCESEINDNKLRNLNYLVEPDALQVWDDDDNNTLHITANITHTHTQTHKPIERTTISEMVMMFVIKQQAWMICMNRNAHINCAIKWNLVD